LLKKGDLVFGSRDLDVNSFEKRVIVFECDSFSKVKEPVIFDPSSLEIDEVFPPDKQ
jgi:hypothetical protein